MRPPTDQTKINFIEKIGLEEDSTTGELQLRTAEFSFKRPVPDTANPGAVIEQEATLTAPLLSMAPIPFIRVSDLKVSFEFKIRDVTSNQSKAEMLRFSEGVEPSASPKTEQA